MKLEGKSLKSDFLRFIIPSLVAQWVYAFYTMIDGLFVARGVSEMALSAVNIAMPFVTFIFSVALTFSVGSSTIIAIHLGEGNKKKAQEVFTQNILTVCIVSILISISVFFGVEKLAAFLGSGAETHTNVCTYLVTIAMFSISFIISYSLEVLIKTDGYPVKTTIIVTLGCVLNCILDFLFVIVFHKGVWGAAFATGLSQFVVVLLYMVHFLGKKTNMKLVRFRFDIKLFFRTLRIGLASGITEFSAGIVIFLFNHYITKYLGEAYIASYTVVSYISTIAVMSMAGISQGIQPLVSYYYGKKVQAKCKKLLQYALFAGSILSVVFFAASYLLAEPLASIFISEDLVLLRQETITAFYAFSWSFLLCGYNVILGGYFTSLEYPVSAMAISLGRGLIFVAISLIILTTIFGKDGLWWASTMSETLCLILTVFLYLRNFKWKSNQIRIDYT